MRCYNMTNDRPATDPWGEVVTKAMINSISGLSQMTDQDIRVTSITARTIRVKDAPALVGGRETLTAGVYVGFQGSGSGHMVVIYEPRTAFDLIDMLLGNPPQTTHELGEMEQSVLGEVGNIMGSYFVNTLSDATGLDLRISPPAVMLDMAGAILDAALAQVLTETDDAVVVGTTFGTQDRQIDGNFLVMPNPSLQNAVLRRLMVK